jgi:hypothetical protein
MDDSRNKDLKEALFQHSMYESSINFLEKELDKKIAELEKLPEVSPETDEKRKEVWQILRKLRIEEVSISKFTKENEENP